jgi:hypothetical protein
MDWQASATYGSGHVVANVTAGKATCGQSFKVWPGFSSQGRYGVARPGEAVPASMDR